MDFVRHFLSRQVNKTQTVGQSRCLNLSLSSESCFFRWWPVPSGPWYLGNWWRDSWAQGCNDGFGRFRRSLCRIFPIQILASQNGRSGYELLFGESRRQRDSLAVCVSMISMRWVSETHRLSGQPSVHYEHNRYTRSLVWCHNCWPTGYKTWW